MQERIRTRTYHMSPSCRVRSRSHICMACMPKDIHILYYDGMGWDGKEDEGRGR